VRDTFRLVARPLPLPDRAALVLIAALTMLACLATVVPLYLLARGSFDPELAWSIAALWPLVPSALLFQPAADTAFPLLSTAALACALPGSGRPTRSALLRPAAAGVLLGLGMQFTLAFLAVGLVVGLLIGLSRSQLSPRDRLLHILATGVGFLAITLGLWALSRANPLVIWYWNQRNHARFYVEYPRSFAAWLVVNPIETAVGLGLPAAFWAAVGLSRPRETPAADWAALGVMALLTLSGRSLSEVARLWLPLFPALLLATAAGWRLLDAGLPARLATLALVGIQVIVLAGLIQVVYPV
jgi:hypothetical protein